MEWGRGDVSTGIGFLDHLLTLFLHHGLFDLNVAARGICTWTLTSDRGRGDLPGAGVGSSLGDARGSCGLPTATCRWMKPSGLWR